MGNKEIIFSNSLNIGEKLKLANLTIIYGKNNTDKTYLTNQVEDFFQKKGISYEYISCFNYYNDDRFTASIGTTENVGKLHMVTPSLLKEFEEIAGGTYKVEDNNMFRDSNIIFTPLCDVGYSSGYSRSFVRIWYWLKYFAEIGDVLIFDEPELNLHPEKQRELARFMVKLINNGVKIFLTTHSDFIIKEFNILIMLAQNNTHTQKIQEKYKYKDNELLSTADVKLYMTDKLKSSADNHGYTLTEANISPTQGINVPTFDIVINEMNSIQEDILFSE